MYFWVNARRSKCKLPGYGKGDDGEDDDDDDDDDVVVVVVVVVVAVALLAAAVLLLFFFCCFIFFSTCLHAPSPVMVGVGGKHPSIQKDTATA